LIVAVVVGVVVVGSGGGGGVLVVGGSMVNIKMLWLVKRLGSHWFSGLT
jgi:hypothetical protein